MATLTPRSTPAYVVDGLNQYTSVGSQNIGYDLNGNLTSDGAFAFAYDPENRLMRAAKTGTSATYAYDPLGRRTTKTVNGTATYFLVSGDDEIAEYDGSGNLLRRYVPGPGVDQPIAMVASSGTRSFFHQDKTGSVVAMADSTGAITEGPYTYDPFGNGAPTTGVPYKYTGRRLDPETGLYYYRARYYSPAIGRFLQTDPVGYKDDIDWYTYVGNDPTNRVDPTGLKSNDGSNGSNCDANFAACQHFEFSGSSKGQNSGGTNGAGIENRLTYHTVVGDAHSNSWEVNFNLDHNSPKGGIIVQHVVGYFSNSTVCDGHGNCNYYEVWTVKPGDHTSQPGTDEYGNSYSDKFGGPSGSHVRATAIFYEDMTIPATFTHNPQIPSGILPSTTTDPHLPTDNATAPIDRWWGRP